MYEKFVFKYMLKMNSVNYNEVIKTILLSRNLNSESLIYSCDNVLDL